MKVLLVDDDKMVREMFAESLSALYGWAVLTAANGPDALKMLKEGWTSPDILVTDREMPGMLGEELIRRAKALHPDLPAIMITGKASPDAWKVALAAGASKVIVKPANIADLAAAIEDAVAEKN